MLTHGIHVLDLMSPSSKNAPRRSANITICILLVVLTIEAQSRRTSKHGFIVLYPRQLRQSPKMTAEPAATPQLAPAGTEKIEEADSQKSRFRQTIESIKQDTASSTSEESKEQRKEETAAWRVVLYNDDIHSFTYVTESLANAVPLLSHEVAHTITVEAHNSGQATILRTWKKKAEAYCVELQKRGLTVCTIHDPSRK